MTRTVVAWATIVGLGLVGVWSTVETVAFLTRNEFYLRELVITLVLVVSWALFAVVLIPRRNVSRVAALRKKNPGAIVMGAQVDSHMLNSLSAVGGEIESTGRSLGDLWAVMADVEGVSFWRGKASDLQRRAFIPWSATGEVIPGRAAFARELESVRVLLSEKHPQDILIDFVPNREGLFGSWAILSIARVGVITKSVGEIRSAALANGGQVE